MQLLVPQPVKTHHRAITLWVGLQPNQLKRQLKHLEKKVAISYWNGHRPIKHEGITLSFIHFPEGKYGFGMKICTFECGEKFTISALALKSGGCRAILIPVLRSLGVKASEEHAVFFQTIH
ncbi:MAG: hypothetical protein Q7R64_04245 [bacterium]|nr:hypothetical protein [bacterium]